MDQRSCSNRFQLGLTNERASFLPAFILIFLLLVPGSCARAEDEAARAPLPPPLPTASSQPGLSPIKAETDHPRPRPDQPNFSTPAIRVDRAKNRTSQGQTSQGKSGVAATAHRGSAPDNGRNASDERGNQAASRASRHLRRHTIASSAKPRRRASPTVHEAGRLSPPNEGSAPRIESAATGPLETPRAAIPYYLDPPADLPSYRYVPVYPYPWPPPAAAPFR